MSRGVRTPETTSSPCAFGRKSPEGVGSPVISSREKATPEHELSPLFPNTICCTFTAVPQSSGMWLMRRYSTARLPVHESNTAVIACLSCSCGSCGKASPVSCSKSSLKRRVSSASSPASRSTSSVAPTASLRSLISSS
jgi:hypothetical protein